MITARTYWVGVNGTVRRSDDEGLTWVSKNLPGGIGVPCQVTLLDVETDPVDPDKVYAVGKLQANLGYFGIYVSSDGGNTWQIPSGTYKNPFAILGYWIEVCVVDADNIFVSGTNGWVCKSTDGGQSFNLCTQAPLLIPYYGGTPARFDCDSLHFIDENRGVVGLINNVIRTTDGGATWTVCTPNGIQGPASNPPHPGNGGNLPLQHFTPGIHVDSTFTKITICGTHYLMHSEDSGTTWPLTYLQEWSAGRNGLHLTWQDDLRLWGFGYGNERYRSLDGGLTWIPLEAFNADTFNQRAGHFYNGDTGFYSNGNFLQPFIGRVMRHTTDGAFMQYVESDIDPGGTVADIGAVWTLYKATCYELTPCEGEGDPIIVLNELGNNVGQVVQICPPALPTGTPFPIGQFMTYYTLTDCCDVYPDIIGAAYPHTLPLSGSYVNIPSFGDMCWQLTISQSALEGALIYNWTGYTNYGDCPTCLQSMQYTCPAAIPVEECTCFEVSEASNCEGAITVEIANTFADCAACLPDCYLLTNCVTEETVLTNTDLSAYVGMVITFTDCDDICWSVEVSQDCTGAVPVGTVDQSYPNCPSCVGIEPTPTVPLNIRRVKPGYNTPGCDPAFTEMVSCTFAKNAYDDMMVRRYGITRCCANDDLKWNIKKEILDLKAIYDPDLCQAVICCPPCGVNAYIYEGRIIC